MLASAKFTAEWLEDERGSLVLNGYSDGRDWNGWAWPFLTHAAVEALASRIDSVALTNCEDDMTRIALCDDASIKLIESDGTSSVIEPAFADTDAGAQKLYDLGGSWTWEFVEGDNSPPE